jgi:hypothetical protein
MFVSLVDYNGHPASVDANKLVKLRPALSNLGDPEGCTLVDYGSGGLFALGDAKTIRSLFEPHVPLASLHAPDGTPIYINAYSIAGVQVDAQYAGKSVAVVAAGYENQNVPSRNKIGLRETVEEATAIFEQARQGEDVPAG